MTKTNVTTEEMGNHFDSMVSILPSIARDEQCEICDAIRSLIADYPRLKAKYDALKGKVKERAKKAGLLLDALDEDEPYPAKVLDAMDFLAEIRDFEEE